MDVQIVIPTKNEEEYLSGLLECLKNQTFKKFKTVIADVYLSNKTKEIAKKYGCKIVKGGLPAIARDNGAKEAIKNGAKILIFIDADVYLPSKNFLKDALEEFKEEKLDVAGTLITPFKKIKNKKYKPTKDPKYRMLFWGSNIMFKLSRYTKSPMMQAFMVSKTKVHKKVGGFGNIEYREDSEYSKRAVKNGFKFNFLKKPGKILLSVRRFEKKGFTKMLLLYLKLNVEKAFGNNFEIKKKRAYFK